MSLKQFAALATLSILSAAAPQSAHGQGAPSSAIAPDEDRRRSLYQQGKDAIKAQRWVDARTKLLDAWTIRPSYDVALSLSQAEFNLEAFAESAQYLAYYFRNVSAKENEKNLANAKQAFEAAKAKVSSVQLTAPKGADVSIDGKVVGIAPLEDGVFVKPGKRVFEAQQGALKSAVELQALAGKEQFVTLSFSEATPTAVQDLPVASGLSGPGPTIEPLPTSRSSARSLVPVVLGAATTLVATGLGVGFRLASNSSHEELLTLREGNGSNGCTDGTAVGSECVAQQVASDTTDTRRNISTTAFVLAGVAAVGTAVYWFWPRTDTSEPAGARQGLRLSGAVEPGGAGVWLSGGF